MKQWTTEGFGKKKRDHQRLLGNSQRVPLKVKFLRGPLRSFHHQSKCLIRNPISRRAERRNSFGMNGKRSHRNRGGERRSHRECQIANISRKSFNALYDTRKTQQNPRISLTSTAKRSEMRLDCVRNASYCRRRLLTIHNCVVKTSDA